MEKNNSKANQYKYTQIFGYKGPNQRIMEEDIITALRFDHTGNHLAVGDKAGRVIVFEAKENKKGPPTYEYFSEFQSHLKEFDALRSFDVQEEILNIRWMKPQGKYHKITTTNSRNIKLWKLYQKSEKKVVRGAGKELGMPKLQVMDTSYVADLQKSFPNRHISPINTISISDNEEYLLSSDQAQIFMWSLERPDKPFLLVNHAPPKGVEEAPESVTCSQFHPTSDNLYAFGMNKGTLKVNDLRLSSHDSGISFGEGIPPKNYVYQLLSSHSSLCFIKGGKYLASRDCLSVKLWDSCNPKKPVQTIILNDGIKSKLCQMVQNESIFDKFNISASHDGNTLLTGSYNNTFHLLDPQEGLNCQYQLNYSKRTIVNQMKKGSTINRMDYLNKTIAGDFNRQKNLLAVASKNTFFTYSMP